jgi:hypothetical protein
VTNSKLEHTLVGARSSISDSQLSHSMLGDRVMVRGLKGTATLGDDSEVNGT